MRTLLALLLVSATFAFALGSTLPLIDVQRLWLLKDEPSLVTIVASLWKDGEELLAVVIGLFSLALPATKLVWLHVVALGGGSGPLHRAMDVVAKWSMLDVVLVAIVIFAAKTSGLAAASTRAGLWFFAASAILTAAASSLSKRMMTHDPAYAGREPPGSPSETR